MKILRAGEEEFKKFVSEVEGRITQDSYRIEKEVRSILKEVKQRGDEALIHYTELFDRVHIPIHQIRIKREEIKEAYREIPKEFLETLKKAAYRIQRFHRSMSKRLSAQFISRWENGTLLGQIIRPLERVGIYVPGGKASYPSTVLMAAIPANVAGVKEIIMVTPPQKERVSPAILIAADLAKVDQIYRVGGAQAIAALAYGTNSIPKVDKIVGPGNQYVAIAKRLVYGTVDIDMVAGPSEIVIISDGKTPPAYIASDLISQAEHDEMAMAILITLSEEFGRKVSGEVERQLISLKRKKIASASLKRRGAILIVKDIHQAIQLANKIAPEHLELCIQNAPSWVKKVKHAGAVFLGSYTPEAIGDYLAGPNHILPTAGTSRFSSPLGVEDFIKRTSLLHFTQRSLKRFERDVMRFAEWEGLEGHYQSVQMRMKK